MRISITRSKNGIESLYVIKDRSSATSKGSKKTTSVYERLGRMQDLMHDKNMSRDEVIAWAKAYAKGLTLQEKKEREIIPLRLHPKKLIAKGEQRSFNCGYLFLQSIYYGLKMDNVCRNITNRYKFQYPLDAILSDLIYARVLSPASKQASYKYCQSLLEPPKYQQEDVYRALSVLAKEMDYIQAEVYKNSHFLLKRNNRVLYYDCTNYYFEIQEEDGSRMYGKSKENRPNPIIQMGLFMDGDGIPLAFNLFPGNQSEQPSMKPLEQKVLRDFGLKKVVVCTDAGLGADANRAFNDIGERAFIMTQSLKKLDKAHRESAMDDRNWRRLSDGIAVDIREIKEHPEEFSRDLFYKEDVYGTDRVPGQLMLVTYSPKYALYQKNIRSKQVERAEKMVANGKSKRDTHNPNDPARFVSKVSVTAEGEAADKTIVSLNEDRITEESKYDGFYAVCTNLVDDSVKDILDVSEGRWEIEESFRIMKSDFEARPVYLSREDRIKAHFLTCYLALLEYRILEKKLQEKYTTNEIISTLRSMNLVTPAGVEYVPSYMRTDLTDDMHEAFGFRTDYEVLTRAEVRNIIRKTKTG